MKIMHFTVDEKFIPFVQEVYEDAFPGNNEYRVLGYVNRGLKYISPALNVKVADSGYWTSTRLENELSKFDCVVIHYLAPEFIEAIARIPTNVMIVWSGWGGDYESLLEPQCGPYVLDLTRAMPQRDSIFQRIKPYLANPLQLSKILIEKLQRPRAAFSNENNSEDIKRIANRFNVISVTPAEVPYMINALSQYNNNINYHTLHYYCTETVFQQGPIKMEGDHILVGNSASPTNNHIEAFEFLKNIDTTKRKIIVPLSYGPKRYAEAVIRCGYRYFGKNFTPLVNFMPLAEYNEVISQCGTVLMNHVRQQAVGNIFSAIYKGAVVYLRPENPLSTFCQDLKLNIKLLPENYTLKDSDIIPLNTDEILENRQITGEHWSYNNVVNAVRQLEQYRKI